MGAPLKVVLDTNVIVSAFLWQGRVSSIFKLAREGKIVICVSADILDELTRVLKYHKLASHIKRLGKSSEEIVTGFLQTVEYYNVPRSETILIAEDPDDDKFITCAVAAGADFLVTGDKTILKYANFCPVQILTPAAFLKKFGS